MTEHYITIHDVSVVEVENIYRLRNSTSADPVALPSDLVLSKFAEEHWMKEVAVVTSRLDSSKADAVSAKNEVYQLIGFYSIFQGVIFTAAAQSSRLKCPNKHVPISLSVLATVFTLFGLLRKLWDLKKLKSDINEQQQNRNHLQSILRKVREKRVLRKLETRVRKEKETFFKDHLSIVVYSSAVIAFSVLVNNGIWLILCKPGSD